MKEWYTEKWLYHNEWIAKTGKVAINHTILPGDSVTITVMFSTCTTNQHAQ